MKYFISKLTVKKVIKGMLLCSLFALGINELAKAGTVEDPAPPLTPPPVVVAPPPPPPPPPPSIDRNLS